jgi:hypothetical protein
VENPKSTTVENLEPMGIENSEGARVTVDVGESSVPLRRTSRRVDKKPLYNFDVHNDEEDCKKNVSPRSNKINAASTHNNDEGDQPRISKKPRRRKANSKSLNHLLHDRKSFLTDENIKVALMLNIQPFFD